MKLMKKLFFVVILATGCSSAFATDKSQMIANQCKKNAQYHQDWTDCIIESIKKYSSPSTKNANLNKIKRCEENLMKPSWTMVQLDQCYMNILKKLN